MRVTGGMLFGPNRIVKQPPLVFLVFSFHPRLSSKNLVFSAISAVETTGIEPATSGLQSRRSPN